jgi:hypothetical protein
MAKFTDQNRGSSNDGGLLSSPLAFLIFCVVAAGLIFAVMMWREGRLFPHLFEASGATIEAGDRSWMGGGGRRAARPIDPGKARTAVDPFANAESDENADAAPTG